MDAFAVDQRGVDLTSGLAGAIATAGPLAIGLAAGNRAAGLIAAIGGLNTALCVPRAGWRSRLWWGTIGALGGCGSVALASLAPTHTWLLALVTVAWVGGWALLRTAGPPAALTAFGVSAVFVIVSGFPRGTTPLASRELWFALGAAGGLALMMAARAGPSPPGPLPKATLTAVRAGVRDDEMLRAYALRLALSVALATVIYRLLQIPHGYWVPLTVLATFQPGARATEVRCVQRAAGTLVGVAVIVVITLLTADVWVLVLCTAIASLGLFALDERGYFWLVVMLTPAALFMLSIADFQGFEVGVERTLNSAVGIVLGLVIGETASRVGRRRPAPDASPRPNGGPPQRAG